MENLHGVTKDLGSYFLVGHPQDLCFPSSRYLLVQHGYGALGITSDFHAVSKKEEAPKAICPFPFNRIFQTTTGKFLIFSHNHFCTYLIVSNLVTRHHVRTQVWLESVCSLRLVRYILLKTFDEQLVVSATDSE